MERSLLTKSFPGTDMPGESSMVGWCILAAAAGAGLSILLSLIPNVEPFWVFLAVICAVAMIIGMIKFPAAFLVPPIFIPGFKDSPYLEFLQRNADLTVLCMILLIVAILLNLLLDLIRPAGWSLRQLFAGQWKGVGTFFLFAVIVTASYSYSPATNYGWVMVYKFWGIGVLLFLSPLILVKHEKDFRHFVIAFIFFGMLQATEMVTRIELVVLPETEDVTRITVGWVMGTAILLILYYRLFETRLRHLLWVLFCVPWLVTGVVASVSRGAVLSVVFALGLTSLMTLQKRRLLPRLVASLGVLILVVATGMMSFYFLRQAPTHEAKFREKAKEIIDPTGGQQFRGTGLTRPELYSSALRAIPEKPILGWGVGGFAIHHFGRDEPWDPHNLFLLIAVEQGLVGLVVFVAFLEMVASAIWRILDATGDCFVVLFSVLVCTLSNTMFAGNLDDVRMLWLWCSLPFAVSRMVDMGLVTARLNTR